MDRDKSVTVCCAVNSCHEPVSCGFHSGERSPKRRGIKMGGSAERPASSNVPRTDRPQSSTLPPLLPALPNRYESSAALQQNDTTERFNTARRNVRRATTYDPIVRDI